MARFKIKWNILKADVSIARYKTDKLGYERKRRSSTDTGESVITHLRSTKVYIGPSVEGPDVKYMREWVVKFLIVCHRLLYPEKRCCKHLNCTPNGLGCSFFIKAHNLLPVKTSSWDNSR